MKPDIKEKWLKALRLVGQDNFEWIPCPECKGRGKVPCPVTFSSRSNNWHKGEYVPQRQPGDGYPIPCPKCKGKKEIHITENNL